jgi:hypothetical protein
MLQDLGTRYAVDLPRGIANSLRRGVPRLTVGPAITAGWTMKVPTGAQALPLGPRASYRAPDPFYGSGVC